MSSWIAVVGCSDGAVPLLANGGSIADWVLWFASFLALVLAGGFVLYVLRKRVRETPLEGRRPVFSLEELRRLRDRGELSPTEYESLREHVVAQLRETDAPPPNQRTDRNPLKGPVAD